MAVTFARIGVMFGKMRTFGRPEPHRNRKVPLAKKSEQQTEAGLLLYPKNRVLCRLGDSEFYDGLRTNLHLLLRLGIEARACFSLLLHQLAKTGQDEFTVLLDLFVCERAERIEEYACGFFVGLGRSRECDLKFSLGHPSVVYGSGIAPFQENRSRFHSCLQSSSTCSTALISPWMLIVCFRHILVKERIQSAQARICAFSCGSRRVSRSLPLLVLCCSSDTQKLLRDR